MAIYHFSAKVVSRANGSSAVASAAYRAAERLTDERLGRDHDFTNKAGVVHSEIMLPEGAPERLADREALWNVVEAGEVRKDAQLARDVEFAIPREMNEADGIALARDFVAREFVARAMIADAHRTFANEIAQHAKIDNVRTCGTILALTVRTSGVSHYLSQERDRIYHYFLARGVLLRPIGNVLYLIPPYCISAEQLRSIYAHIRDFLHTDGSADLNIV